MIDFGVSVVAGLILAHRCSGRTSRLVLAAAPVVAIAVVRMHEVWRSRQSGTAPCACSPQDIAKANAVMLAVEQELRAACPHATSHADIPEEEDAVVCDRPPSRLSSLDDAEEVPFLTFDIPSPSRSGGDDSLSGASAQSEEKFAMPCLIGRTSIGRTSKAKNSSAPRRRSTSPPPAQCTFPEPPVFIQHGSPALAAAARMTTQDTAAVSSGAVPPSAFTDGDGQQWCIGQRCIGSGAYSRVFIGACAGDRGSSDETLVAIKTVQLARHAHQLGRLAREIGVLKLIKEHGGGERLLPLYGYAVSNGFLLMATPWMPHGSLSALQVSFGVLRPRWVRRYGREVLEALMSLHSAGIIHRDVKPANILLNAAGHCVLADFGSAVVDQPLSEAIPVEGTPVYMAPEACQGRPQMASDVFSFGITLFQLLSGALPWTPIELAYPKTILLRHGVDPAMAPVWREKFPTELATINGAPAPVMDLLAACLAPDPRDRPTCAELLHHSFFVH